MGARFVLAAGQSLFSAVGSRWIPVDGQANSSSPYMIAASQSRARSVLVLAVHCQPRAHRGPCLARYSLSQDNNTASRLSRFSLRAIRQRHLHSRHSSRPSKLLTLSWKTKRKKETRPLLVFLGMRGVSDVASPPPRLPPERASHGYTKLSPLAYTATIYISIYRVYLPTYPRVPHYISEERM